MNESIDISRFPRLFDLASATGLADQIASVQETHQQELEEFAQQLDQVAYDQFRSKMACTIGRQKSWFQFLDDLNEINGYLYLRSQGYSDIQFVKNEESSTPDLSAKCNGARALLEVKTIRTSDDDNAYVTSGLSNSKKTRDVLYELPDGLKNKLLSDIKKARRQLLNYCSREPVAKRIVLFVVTLDANCATNEFMQALSVFLDAASDENVTITHVIRNTIWL